ncbi:hypothetical protein N2152v2_010286 [Parachlorella kessleri]
MSVLQASSPTTGPGSAQGLSPRTPHVPAQQHDQAEQAAESEGEEGSEGEYMLAEGGSDDEDDDYLVDGEEEEEEEEDSEVDDSLQHPVHRLMQMIGVSSSRQAQSFQRIPRGYVPPPLSPQNDLAVELSTHSSAAHPRHPMRLALPCKRQVADASVTNPAHQLLVREGSFDGRGGRLSAAQRAHFVGTHRLPSQTSGLGDRMRSRGYIGQFARDGDLFVAAFQNERRVKIYDVHQGWATLKNVHARGLRWTVTDTCLSSDQKFLLYASISATVHLVNVQRGHGEAEESVANVTDIHEPLHFAEGGDAVSYSTGIWSLRWSSDNSEIVAGAGDNSLYVYDVTQAKTVVRVEGHQDDVNAVAYADETCKVIFSGSDDCLVKVWDRRLMSGRRSKPAGVLVGHCEGITHIDAKGDGRYLISNGKDQTVKLWDLRGMRSHAEAQQLRRDRVPHFSWDYRWMEYPGRDRLVTHPHDASLMTYRGHSVLSTLIRAYWSPPANTGQRYIYTGSADGGVWVYDVLTGRVVTVLRYHREVVRDCSWHPYLPMLASVSFDGTVCCWEPEPPGEAEMDLEEQQAKQAKRAGAGAREPKGPGSCRARRSTMPIPAADQLNDEWP